MYRIASEENPDETAAAAEYIQSLSPQDPRLSMTDALRALGRALSNLRRSPHCAGSASARQRSG
jgi:hypothetical protein